MKIKELLISEYLSKSKNTVEDVKKDFCKKFDFDIVDIVVTQEFVDTYKILIDDMEITCYHYDNGPNSYYFGKDSWGTKIETRLDLIRAVYRHSYPMRS